MKIAFFSSSRSIIPPIKTGGVEQPTFYLIKELIKKNHKITLYAAPGSKITGVKIKEISPFPTFVNHKYANTQERITSFYDLTTLSDFFYSGEADKYDVIIYINYIFYEILPFVKYTKTLILIQISYPHIEIYPYIKEKLSSIKNVYYLPVSNFVKSLMPKLPYLEPVYPVFDFNHFVFAPDKGDYLLFIGRICPEKGTHLAVQVAKISKKKLIIAGRVSESNEQYFRNKIKPCLNKDIVYVGEVGFKEKIKLYQRAIVTLFPIQWDEPFGVVLLESMACGTPVITFDRAAVREIIKEEVTGYIVKDADVTAMAKAVGKTLLLNRKVVRQWGENNFSIQKEANKFIKICQKLIRKKKN